MHHTPQELDRCIKECQECHEVCLRTLSYCIEKGGRHTAAPHLRVMLDCVEICRTSADFMLRGSELHTATCRACAEVCERCADDCARMNDDETMRRCAETCRRCAQSCAEMAGVTVR